MPVIVDGRVARELGQPCAQPRGRMNCGNYGQREEQQNIILYVNVHLSNCGHRLVRIWPQSAQFVLYGRNSS
jgi:hypothetical protein